MSRKPRYQEEYDSTMSNAGFVLGILIAIGFILIKLTYYVALPVYHLFTKLFAEKFSNQHYVNWMRFLPLTWFVTGETKEMRKAAVSMTLFPISLVVFLVTNQMFSTHVLDNDDFLAYIVFLSFFFTVGSIIGLVRNYRFSKKITKL